MKKEMKAFPLIHPTPIALIGSLVNGVANYCTVGDVAVAGLNPPLVMISLGEKHLTNIGIEENMMFSINIPNVELMDKVDYCGVYSGRNKDKPCLFEHTHVNNSPIITKCPINLTVKVLKTHQIEHRVIYIGEVTKTFIDDSIMKNGKLNLETMKPILYGLDNKYYSIGDVIGEGYKEFKNIET